jgi:SAM-dependent methyltransferase
MTEQTFFHRLEESGPYRWLRNRMNHGLVDFLHRHTLAGREHLRVAELACGSGYASHLLASYPEVILSVATDINREIATQASIPDFAAEYALVDIFKPAFAPGSFDLVWNSSSLEHFEHGPEGQDTPAALRTMAALARPGGYVFVGVPYLWGPLALYYLTPTEAQREWLGRPFRYRQLAALFEQANLQIENSLIYLGRCFVGILARKLT